MVTGAMLVDLGRDGEMPEWFSLVAFGTISEVLATHAKGDMVAVSGRLTKSAWTGRDGAERAGFSVCVDGIASARAVRPGKPKARPRDAQGGMPFDGELRF
jgi:single-stranded DNA-binding protein